MNRLGLILGRVGQVCAKLVVVAGVCLLLLAAVLLAQNSPKPPPALSDSSLEAASTAQPSAQPPVDFFRELLAREPDERPLLLTNRPPEIQNLILAKVAEYEDLDPDQRELRLRVTELRWYLLPLMSSPPTNRPLQLARIPVEDRKLVTDRIQAWDKLPVGVQRELLDNEATIRYFSELAVHGPLPVNTDLTSQERQEKLSAGIRQFQAMSESQRRKVISRFNQFFDLTPEEKVKSLSILSDTERRQINQTLQVFGNLGQEQRAECIRSFEKFARLSPADREQFLKNAERWKAMLPAERESWRKLVSTLSAQAPLPPGLDLPPLPLAGEPPPLPP